MPVRLKGAMPADHGPGWERRLMPDHRPCPKMCAGKGPKLAASNRTQSVIRCRSSSVSPPPRQQETTRIPGKITYIIWLTRPPFGRPREPWNVWSSTRRFSCGLSHSIHPSARRPCAKANEQRTLEWLCCLYRVRQIYRAVRAVLILLRRIAFVGNFAVRKATPCVTGGGVSPR